MFLGAAISGAASVDVRMPISFDTVEVVSVASATFALHHRLGSDAGHLQRVTSRRCLPLNEGVSLVQSAMFSLSSFDVMFDMRMPVSRPLSRVHVAADSFRTPT